MDVRFIAAGVGLFLLAAFQYCYLSPRLQRLPANYVSEASYNATARARDSASAPWVASTLVARRVDQMLVASAAHGILQGDLHWTDATGQVAYETSAIFGIDRRTRENLPGYGDTVRTGPFLFPLHTEKKSYRYWDTQFIGHCDALFQHEARLGDMTVYVFSFTARQLDETAGYDHLPDVPELFRVLTDAQGTLWIEPTSGVVVDYVEKGVSYLVNAASGQRVADVYEWQDRYTPQSLADKRRLAQAQRTRVRLLDIWIPGALTGAGVLALLLGWRRRAATALAAREGQA